MTRMLLIAFFLLGCVPAHAEWVLVNNDDDEKTAMYIDLASIRRKGDVVKLWELMDHKTARTVVGELYLSIKAQREYDCAEERYRTLAVAFFAGNMGSGKAGFHNSDVQKWESVQPDSVGQALWRILCKMN